LAALIASPTSAAPTAWNLGDEAAWTGHTFTEEYWTAEVTNATDDGANATFIASYVDAGPVEAFLVAFKDWEKGNATATLPYQLFGMHYLSPEGRDVFMGGVFAYLMAFNDTYPAGGNGLPNPGHEEVFYVLPFGVDNQFTNASYPLEVSAIAATKVADGHYRFGVSYKNMVAKIISANGAGQFWLTAALPLYVARFSELTVTYDVKVDEDAHTATAETFYTIGEVQKLWLWGQSVDPHLLNESWGLAAVHYGVFFTSAYTVEDGAGTTLSSNIDEATAVTELDFKIGGTNRFAKIGFRGTYDLIDEPDVGAGGSDTLVSSDNQAVNAIVGARPVDRLLVLWQYGLSANIFSVFAYGMSEQVRADFTSPQDLLNRAGTKFIGNDFWYAVSFPHWQGYKVVHDPTYEAFFQAPASAGRLPGFEAPVALASAGIAGLVAVWARRRDEA
jgi:hypothetical protein